MPYDSPDDKATMAEAMGPYGPGADQQLGQQLMAIPEGTPLMGPGSIPQPPPPPQSTAQDLVASGALPRGALPRAQQAPPPPAQQALANAGGLPGGAPPSAPPIAPEAKPDMSKVFVPGQGGAGQTAPQAPAAPKMVQVPEHFINTLPPEYRKILESGQLNQMQGAADTARAQAETATGLGSQQISDAAEMRRSAQEDSEEYQRQAGQMQQHLAQAQQRQQEVSMMKVDPEHWMHTRSAGQKLAMALAMAAGGFVAGMKGGPNQAAEQIQHAIDDDIKAQESDIRNKREGANAATNLLAQKYAIFGDMHKAKLATRQELMAASAMHLQGMAQTYKGQEAMAALPSTLGDLQQRIAMVGHEINKYVPAQTIGGPLSPEKQAALEHTRAETEKLKAETEKTRGEAGGGAAPGQLAQDVLRAPETSLTHGHPINYLESKLGIQGTEGAKAGRDIDAYNTSLELALHKAGVRLGDPAKAQQFVGQLRIQPNDTEQLRAAKIAKAREMGLLGPQTQQAAVPFATTLGGR